MANKRDRCSGLRQGKPVCHISKSKVIVFVKMTGKIHDNELTHKEQTNSSIWNTTPVDENTNNK